MWRSRFEDQERRKTVRAETHEHNTRAPSSKKSSGDYCFWRSLLGQHRELILLDYMADAEAMTFKMKLSS